tara:strand:+ start:235 stop:567 length:333 start_codon:yes stop_codon:yes gene_type:complete
MSSPTVRAISPNDAAEWLASDEPPQFIDVRTPGEYELAHVDGAQLLPMDQLMTWVHTLDPDRPVLVLCHHGIRSMRVALYLASQGFTDAVNLAGGIERWSKEVDARVPRY